MQVKDVMTAGVECINPDATLQKAAQKMRDLDVGPLPVCGMNDRLAGMITDRDIAVRPETLTGQQRATSFSRDRRGARRQRPPAVTSFPLAPRRLLGYTHLQSFPTRSLTRQTHDEKLDPADTPCPRPAVASAGKRW